MPITTSAKKALRASLKKRAFNERRRREMRGALKDARKLVGEGKGADAVTMLPRAYKMIDKAAKRGVIKKNAAARYKSRLSQFVKKGAAK